MSVGYIGALLVDTIELWVIPFGIRDKTQIVNV